MTKIERVAAYRVGDETFANLKDAERAVRILAIADICKLDLIDAENVADKWDEIERDVKEATRGI